MTGTDGSSGCWIKQETDRRFCTSYYGIVPAALGIRQTQKAQAFNLLADGHRAMSLAKAYDAKAAAQALKTVVSEVM